MNKAVQVMPLSIGFEEPRL